MIQEITRKVTTNVTIEVILAERTARINRFGMASVKACVYCYPGKDKKYQKMNGIECQRMREGTIRWIFPKGCSKFIQETVKNLFTEEELEEYFNKVLSSLS